MNTIHFGPAAVRLATWAAVAGLGVLAGCGGSRASIDAFTVSPAVVAAPAASSPSAFTLEFTASSDHRAGCTLWADPNISGAENMVTVNDARDDCKGSHVFACTSSLAPGNDQRRRIACATPWAAAPQLATHDVDPRRVTFQLYVYAIDPDRPGTKDPSGLFYDGAHSEDRALLQVDIR